MDHKVNRVADLFNDASALYNEVCAGGGDTSADSIIANLLAGIENLKGCWEGKDAGTQIQNVVVVHNAMVGIRNSLAELATDASAVAANYRDIQNANGAGLESFAAITTDTKSKTEDYTDERDTVNISSEANTGKSKIDQANNALPEFISQVQRYYDLLMENWTVGTGRDKAQAAFEDFISNSQKYREILSEASESISSAIANYSF